MVIAFGRFYDQAAADGLGGNLYADDFSVDNSANFLDIRLEFAFGDAGDLATDAAEILGFTASSDTAAGTGAFTGKIALSRHNYDSLNH